MIRRALMALGLATFASVALTAVPAPAVTDDGSQLHVVSVDSDGFPTVKVVVSPPSSLAGITLEAADFSLTEKGERRRVAVRALPTNALEVVLVVDTSGSMRPVLESAKAAAKSFIAAMPSTTRFSVVAFGDTPRLVLPPSSAASASFAIDGLTVSGNTALYDGLSLAAAQVSGDAGSGRSVVLLSDGGDTASQVDQAAATNALKQHKANLFAISLLTSESNDTVLDQMAADVGGRAVSVNDAPGLSGVYQSIAAQLKNQYELRYRSTSSSPAGLSVALHHGPVRAKALGVMRPPANATVTPASTPAAPAPTVAPPNTGPVVVAAPTGARSSWSLAAGAGVLFVALLALGFFVFAPKEHRRRLSIEAGIRRVPGPRAAWEDFSHRAVDLAERTLERRGQRRALYRALERGGIPMRPGEFIVLAIGIAIGSGLLAGIVLGGSVVAFLGVAVIVGFGARGYVNVKAQKRRELFGTQLPDTLQLMSSHLRTGYGLLQAIDVVANESDEPTATEFQRIVTENRLGRDLSEALHAACERVGSEDFEWVIQAIDVHREVGGDLGEVLENVAATIRDREHMRRQVRALSADGRLSAIVLVALPIFVFVAMKFVNPDYINLLLDRTAGHIMLLGASALLVAGALWLRRIIRLRF